MVGVAVYKMILLKKRMLLPSEVKHALQCSYFSWHYGGHNRQALHLVQLGTLLPELLPNLIITLTHLIQLGILLPELLPNLTLTDPDSPRSTWRPSA